MEHFGVQLNKIARQFHFVPPLRSIGCCRHIIPLERQNTDHLEFSFRLCSEKETLNVRINGKDLLLKFPHLLVKRPGNVLHHSHESPVESLFFTYDKKYLEFFRIGGLSDAFHGRTFEFTQEISLLLRKIMDLMKHTAEKGICERLDFLSAELLLAVLTDQNKMEKEGASSVEKIASYFRAHFTEEIDLDMLLSSSGFSRRTFFRRWKDFYSVTPAQYIFELKMNEALRLLSETKKDLQEIASMLNFRSAAYFCSAFRKHHGITPGEFRKNNLPDNGTKSISFRHDDA